MSASIAHPNPQMIAFPITRLERVINASAALPSEQNTLYSDLFLHMKSEDQVCKERGISMAEFEEQRANLVRNLVAAST